MVLRSSNFEIPVRFTFQPFIAEWRFAYAETVEWGEEPKLRPISFNPEPDPDKTWLRLRIEVPDASAAEDTLGLHIPGMGFNPSYTTDVDRASIPPDVLQGHENCRNTPDISGRKFQVLICQKPEFKYGLWALEPGDVTKNARAMREEFLSLIADPALGWDWSLRQFLNKWGLWGSGQVYVEGRDSTSFPMLAAMWEMGSGQRFDQPGLMMVIPHLLKAQQERYRKALLPRNARAWLRSHPLNLEPTDGFPPFLVRRNYCAEAIEATITIDHLAGIKHGICKRCHKVFEKETRHKKNYCSERCFNAAGVQRWREKQRKAAKKGANRNAKG